MRATNLHFNALGLSCLLGIALIAGVAWVFRLDVSSHTSPYATCCETERAFSSDSIAVTTTESYTLHLPIMARSESSIRGHLTTSDGTPLPYVRILAYLEPTPTAYTIWTDQNGYYQLDNVPDGTYTIRPSIWGGTYAIMPVSHTVTIPPGGYRSFMATMIPPCQNNSTLFFDNFSNSHSGWGEGSHEVTGTWRYANGEYELALNHHGSIYRESPFSTTTQALLYGTISVDARQVSSTAYNSSYGIRLNWPEYSLIFEVLPNITQPPQPRYWIDYLGPCYPYDPPFCEREIAEGPSSAIRAQNGINSFKIVRCANSTVGGILHYFYINDVFLAVMNIGGSGGTWFTTGVYSQGSSGTTVRFDNFRVQAPTP